MSWPGRVFQLSLITALVAALLGYVRFRIGFIVGLQGLFVGMVLGGILGKLASATEEFLEFSRRVRVALGLTLVFAFTQVCVVAWLYGDSASGPLSWLDEVVSGRTGEFFFSSAAANHHVVSASGKLEGLGWILMSGLDMLLYAFGSLAGLSLGIPTEILREYNKRTLPRQDTVG